MYLFLSLLFILSYVKMYFCTERSVDFVPHYLLWKHIGKVSLNDQYEQDDRKQNQFHCTYNLSSESWKSAHNYRNVSLSYCMDQSIH